MISMDIWVWLSSIITLTILLSIFKDNPLLKLLEYTVVGGATAHYVLMGIQNLRTNGIERIAIGNYTLLIPLLMGFLFFTTYIKQYRWIARYPASLLVGIGTGVAIRLVPRAEIIAQMQATIKPLIGVDPLTAVSNLILMLLVIGGIVMFLFTKTTENKITGVFRTIGRWGILATMGSIYVGQILTFLSSLIGALQSLLINWLGLV